MSDRVLVLGLDWMVRAALERHESTELLQCALRVCEVLKVGPSSAPVEGSYYEEPNREHYFRLMRALQEEPIEREAEVSQLAEYRRLMDVCSSQVFGRPQHHGRLMPRGRDPLTEALLSTEWSLPALVSAAKAIAVTNQDISLVGLAARTNDAVALAAVRESVVLYAEPVPIGVPGQCEYNWQVSQELTIAARRFTDCFNSLFNEELPPPAPEHAEVFFSAYQANAVEGRCVYLGGGLGQHYHWAIVQQQEQLAVREFWASDMWTTQRFRAGPPR